MRKVINIAFILSIILNLILGSILLKNNVTVDSEEYLSRIDSLESIIIDLHNRKDSIRLEIDTVYSELKEVQIKYEKDSNIIINNSILDDYYFFTRYLENYRLGNSYNIPTVERD